MEARTLSITVARSESRSSLWVGSEILPTLTSLLQTNRYSSILVVGDHGASMVVERVVHALGYCPSRTLLIKGGEECKSLADLERLWDFFASSKIDRRALVVGVGGGALTDLVGFAASTFMRGVAFAAIPTTLLAQVDASIGGKSGINFKGVKNVIGSIVQPIAIVADIDTLRSLSERETRSGFAEIVKHGIIADEPYFSKVTSRKFSEWQPQDLIDIIFRSCEIKRSIVEQDPSEQGFRKALNFGHTLGHAIEAYALHLGQPLTHGEAVAIGMNAACFISHRLGLLDSEAKQRCLDGIARAGLPLESPIQLNLVKIKDFLALDKKSVAGTTRWTLLKNIGDAVIDQQVPLAVVDEAIASIQPKADV